MPDKSKKSSAASGTPKPAKRPKPVVADASPLRLHILRRLDESLRFLETAIDRVPEKEWNGRPSPSQWSVGEIVHHLILVEVQRLELIKALIAGTKESLPPRDGPAPDLAVARTSPNRNQALPEMVPKPGLPAKVLRKALRRARLETTSFAGTVDLEKAQALWLRTASLGVVNAAEYLEFISAHMERHTDQILRLRAERK